MPASSTPRPEGRPNIVLIITDQHRLDHTGFGGNSIVQTPNLDRLAASGTVFGNAFAANPICMPNRATILTGRMPSVHGTRFNGISLHPGSETFVRELRRAGYRTGLVGKAHFQNMGNGRAFIDRLSRDWASSDAVAAPAEPGWDLFENADLHREGDVEMPEDFYGFAHVELAVGHGDLMSGHYVRWLASQGVEPAENQGASHALERFTPWWQIWKPALPPELHPTAWVGDRSAAWIDACAREREPFFLQVSFPDPHHPFTPPGRYYDLYDPADVALPSTFDDDHATSMRHLKALRATRGQRPPAVPVQPFSPTEEIYRRAAAAEYGSITCIDDAVGRVLGALEQAGVADETVVVFTSDHAEMFGDHGLMLKASMHYRPALQVPLVIHDPRRSARPARVDALVGSIDLAQTLLALAALEEFAGMQGQSLLPLLDDPTQSLRDALLIEEDEPFDLAMTGRPLRMRTLLTRDARLSLYADTDEGELFDLREDPHELANRFQDPAARGHRAALTERLAIELMSVNDMGIRPTFMA